MCMARLRSPFTKLYYRRGLRMTPISCSISPRYAEFWEDPAVLGELFLMNYYPLYIDDYRFNTSFLCPLVIYEENKVS